jgi:cation-transporting ATPase 13A1
MYVMRSCKLQVPPSSIDAAECVYVVPALHTGKPDIVPLTKEVDGEPRTLPQRRQALERDKFSHDPPAPPSTRVPETLLSHSTVRFEFQSSTFELTTSSENPNTLVWDTVDFPDRLPVSVYSGWNGWSRPSQLTTAKKKWGLNTLTLPSPLFSTLFLQHASAPFFVFQIFCVMLWMLDEYWYYSLFTLATLTGMEALLVFQRITQTNNLRKCRPLPAPLHVFRQGKWSISGVKADELVPGDIISISAVAAEAAPSLPPTAPVPGLGGRLGLPAAAPPPTTAVIPADCIILRGSVVANEAMLTGESTPMLKEALVVEEGKGSTPFDAFFSEGSSFSHARHVVYAGTSVIQASETVFEQDASDGPSMGHDIPLPPDDGAICVVVRTGFDTSQGALMRTISHASERVTVGSWEAFAFILILLVFAVSASYYVLVNGWNDPEKNKYKLVLHCIMIITSVVPPELPIELSLAVNASLATLARRGIFCIEPFRIVYGGLVDTACFDKTGTLTADEFSVTGIVTLPLSGSSGAPSSSHASPQLLNGSDAALPVDTVLVIAGCHSLMALHQTIVKPLEPAQMALPVDRRPKPVTEKGIKVVGDPMECTALQSIGWTLQEAASKDSSSSTSGNGKVGHGNVVREVSMVPLAHVGASDAPLTVKIVKKWPFSSEHKRMTTVIAVHAKQSSGLPSGPQFRVVCKGAPETLHAFFPDIVNDTAASQIYSQTYTALTSTGARVLALGWRQVTTSEVKAAIGSCSSPLQLSDVKRAVHKATRTQMEAGLTFAGFLVLASPLKTDTLRTVKELKAARNRVVMITGDAPLTAVAVARQTGIADDTQASTSVSGHVAGWILELAPPGSPAPLQWWRAQLPVVHIAADAAETHTTSQAAAKAALRSAYTSGASTSHHKDVVSCDYIAFTKAGDTSTQLPTASDVLCVTGPAVGALLTAIDTNVEGAQAALDWLLLRSCVYARMNPSQKENVILAINNMHVSHPERTQHYTLMCGDGTNDVGALKRAHVGVSIISNPTLERRYDTMRLKEEQKKRETRRMMVEKRIQLAQTLGAQPEAIARIREQETKRLAAVQDLDESDEELNALLKSERPTAAAAPSSAPSSIASPPATAAPTTTQAVATGGAAPPEGAAKRQQQEAELNAKLAELQSELLSAGSDGGAVSLGDASIASPFTSRLPSPNACVEILRQGRCTLVATHQVYRILAVNSLVLSYMLSVLYLHGVKTGDTQATAAGMVLTVFFMCISWAKPLKRLAPEQPRTSVFNAPLLISVFGQFLIHLTTLVVAGYLCAPFANSHTSASNSTSILNDTSSSDGIGAPLPSPPLSSVRELDEFSSAAVDLAGSLASTIEDEASIVLGAMKSIAAARSGVETGVEEEPKEKFTPNVLNTTIFLLSTAQQAVTFLVNYTGAPFMQPLMQNKVLLYGVLATVVMCALSAAGLSDEITYMLELVELPTMDLKVWIVGLILGDAACCIMLEVSVRKVFGVGMTRKDFK